MTKDDVVKIIRRECAKAGTPSAWAKLVGVSTPYVSDILAGRRDPGPAVLKPLGIERVVTYRRVMG